ncbi:hypothetical protein [Vibrio sp. D431a]|uniref:hypothetical protein n=1 Tax=Vibrio sp. D431a TaxID=2837388 RepID=UPI002553AD61|nr:hypothetical protein [Vibrio sp. D431a]MDK9790130.1 hypothetical protein [Vibrio sp. D431a]
MSIKIQNALILKNSDLSSVLEILYSKIRPQILTVAETQVARSISKDYFQKHDTGEGTHSFAKGAMKYYFDLLQSEHINTVSNNSSINQWDFTASVYVAQVKNERSVVLLIDSPNLTERLEELLIDEGFQSFNYQNASDNPEQGISEEEWSYRKEVWTGLITRPSSPFMSFYKYQLVDWADYKSSIPFFCEMVNNLKPTTRERARNARTHFEIQANMKHLRSGSMSLYEIVKKAKVIIRDIERNGHDYGVTVDESLSFR